MHRYQDGTYYAVFKINGRTIWRSLHTRSRKEAKGRLVEEMRHTEQLAVLPNSDWTLATLLQMYECSLDGKARKTRLTRKSIAKKFRETWSQGLGIQIADVTALMLRLWLSQQRGRLKAVSYNEYVRFVRQLFGLALEARSIAQSPAADFKLLRPETPKRLTPTWDQFQRILESVRSNRFTDHAEATGDLLEFMGTVGAGQAEAAGLCGEHVDLHRREISMLRQKTGFRYVVPIFPQARALFDRLATGGHLRIGQPVFAIRDPKKSLRGACGRLGYPRFSPRSLRRMFIVRSLERGIDPRLVAQWQGHQDNGALILKVYGRFINMDHAREMADKLA